MRLSTNRSDKWFNRDLCARVRQVRLNGLIIEKVITADEDAGVVIKYAVDEAGNHIPRGDGFLSTEELHGDVRIILGEKI